ncbi:rRNA (cytosine-C(5))-methyltransferase NOP2C [Juglans microcarpa x Juglans regia]|uniref:rRNA (cytosine-C(5))-methyltransferase NOP2C n=1 Tax=Juglans microcarpa x Juglans regia TaxID=2249226 RepID=UPI001B7EA29D|nr:rRNA (cytosine-C(5))-methyltransferase NOP2C [Juglans microcarpa x Juglans regia]
MKKARDLLQTSCRRFLSLPNPKIPKMEDMSERYCYNPILRWNPQVEEYFVKAYGADHFSRVSDALTHPSCYSCIRVNTLQSTSDAVIQKLAAIMNDTGHDNTNDNISKCDANVDADTGLKQTNVPQNLNDWSKMAEALKEDIQTGPVSKCQIPGLDYVVFVKGSGPHTIDYGHTHTSKEVIVSRKCAEAVLRGAQVYVPGVMACSAHVEKGDMIAVSAAVEQPGLDGGWGIGITRGSVLQGLETDAYYMERNGLYIGQGRAMMSRAGMFRALEGVAVDMSNRVFKLPSFHDVLEGEIFLQNLPSIVAAHALDPQKGERILDMCAAPGGKTTAIAILMKDEGEVVAVDRSHNKVLVIQKLAAEMGLNCITTYKLDALKAVSQRNDSYTTTDLGCNEKNNGVTIQSSDTPSLHVERELTEGMNADKSCENGRNCNKTVNERTYVSKAEIRKNIRRMRNGPGRNQCSGGRVQNSKGFSPHSFDRVLLDAPCSALGLRPRLFAGEETIQSLRNHAKYQRRMFDQAVQLARPGGVIVYSTCTINPGENEALVRYALDTYKFLSLAQQHPSIGGPGLLGGCEFPDGYIEEWLRPGEEKLVQRFDPSGPLDTIGFFIAKFIVGSKDG